MPEGRLRLEKLFVPLYSKENGILRRVQQVFVLRLANDLKNVEPRTFPGQGPINPYVIVFLKSQNSN